MTPRRVYYINYIDPKTGFLKREEMDTHQEQTRRINELRDAGVTRMTTGSFESP